MQPDLNHLPVNWIDGMKVSKRHFEETGRYLEERLSDLTALSQGLHRFGVLPATGSLELSIRCGQDNIIALELSSCKAITQNGTRIQVLPADAVGRAVPFNELARHYNLQTDQPQELCIVVSADADHRIPYGELQTGETPLRHPYTQPSIFLDIVPASQLNPVQMPSGLVIGKISCRNGEMIPRAEFIPPCVTVDSLPALSAWHIRFLKSFEEWEACCMTIIRKIDGRPQTGASNALSVSILKFSEKLLIHLAEQKFIRRDLHPHAAPVQWAASLLQTIHLLHAWLQCYPERDREEMLAYFAEWTDTQPGHTEKLTQQGLLLRYDHHDIHHLLRSIDDIYLHLILIFRKLSQLDYIGKRKGQQIFVVEQEVKDSRQSGAAPPPPKTNGRWSPLT